MANAYLLSSDVQLDLISRRETLRRRRLRSRNRNKKLNHYIPRTLLRAAPSSMSPSHLHNHRQLTPPHPPHPLSEMLPQLLIQL
ncbi:hypothetical protein BDR07DRAFT_1403687 [Suillus spraguei]|nr:hypothetical protein BDR07DRAFT_1403687 [Suillus spraguei]